MSSIDLSPGEARKLVLLSQGVHQPCGRSAKGVAKAIELLSYIQIDTISVVERAHHHTLFNRVAGYQQSHLDQLQQQGQIFEYWSHAAAYLPMCDYRFSLPRKKLYLDGEQHWRKRDQKMGEKVLERIRADGPLQARNFERDDKQRAGKNQGWWDWKPAKVALEQLFMEGRLMIAQRVGFQKVYDLAERVVPSNIDTRLPSETELCEHLINRYLQANGIGTPAQIAYLRTGLKPAIADRCKQMVENDELLTVKVGQTVYYTQVDSLELLKTRLTQRKLKILSPFDNLLIQRQRILELFGFDYQIECYVPAAKRKYGYFSLPLLMGRDFVGRMDAKIHRKTGVLEIINLNIETKELDAFMLAFKPCIQQFLKFNSGQSILITRVSNHIKNNDKSVRDKIMQQIKGY